MNNLNTTIDKVALELFNEHYYKLSRKEQEVCHWNMVNNKKWLNKTK